MTKWYRQSYNDYDGWGPEEPTIVNDPIPVVAKWVDAEDGYAIHCDGSIVYLGFYGPLANARAYLPYITIWYLKDEPS